MATLTSPFRNRKRKRARAGLCSVAATPSRGGRSPGNGSEAGSDVALSLSEDAAPLAPQLGERGDPLAEDSSVASEVGSGVVTRDPVYLFFRVSSSGGGRHRQIMRLVSWKQLLRQPVLSSGNKWWQSAW